MPTCMALMSSIELGAVGPLGAGLGTAWDLGLNEGAGFCSLRMNPRSASGEYLMPLMPWKARGSSPTLGKELFLLGISINWGSISSTKRLSS